MNAESRHAKKWNGAAIDLEMGARSPARRRGEEFIAPFRDEPLGDEMLGGLLHERTQIVKAAVDDESHLRIANVVSCRKTAQCCGIGLANEPQPLAVMRERHEARRVVLVALADVAQEAHDPRSLARLEYGVPIQ